MNRATTAAPSPTAEATRFVEPDRTSPWRNTRGRLVLERQVHRRRLCSFSTSLPVEDVAFSSSARHR